MERSRERATDVAKNEGVRYTGAGEWVTREPRWKIGAERQEVGGVGSGCGELGRGDGGLDGKIWRERMDLEVTHGDVEERRGESGEVDGGSGGRVGGGK